MTERRDPDEVVSGYPFVDEESSAEDGPFVCPECEMEFSTERGLNVHRGQKHDERSG
jgi:hypothetical protein